MNKINGSPVLVSGTLITRGDQSPSFMFGDWEVEIRFSGDAGEPKFHNLGDNKSRVEWVVPEGPLPEACGFPNVITYDGMPRTLILVVTTLDGEPPMRVTNYQIA